jgi:L-asparaginase
MMEENVIQIFTTGGSIDKCYSTADSDFIVGDPVIKDWLKHSGFSPGHNIKSLSRKDSLELDNSDLELIHNSIIETPSRKIVVTHGTDTMVQTANFLRTIPGKTIVLTGSMQPAAFIKSDAFLNLGFALAAVQLLSPGIYIAMNGRVFLPDKVYKDPEQNIFVDL